MGIAGLVAARDRLIATRDAALPPDGMCRVVLESVRLAAPFEAGYVMLVDSDTMLPMAGVVAGLPEEACAPHWDSELLDPDFGKFAALAQSTERVHTLFEATDGDLARSPRYRKVYRALGAVDEMRAVFMSGTTCLAIGSFIRIEPAEPFLPDEAANVSQLMPPAVALLRRALSQMIEQSGPDATTVVILNGAGVVESITEGGWKVLAELLTPGGEEEDGLPKVPTIVRAAATRVRWSRTTTRLATWVRDRTGRWLRMNLAPLDGDPTRVAVTIQPARPGDLVPILLESYGLTPRESEIALLLIQGRAVKQIAAELAISPHTVRDHLKAVYAKTAVGARGELVAKLFSGHLIEQLHRHVETV